MARFLGYKTSTNHLQITIKNIFNRNSNLIDISHLLLYYIYDKLILDYN